jgi:molecular chaperone DnaK
LNVTAKDKATSNEQKITITSSSGLSKDEVDKMTRDAESHAADDRKQRDTIEAKNRADAMVFNVEKTLKEHRSKISEAEAKEIEAAIEETKKAIAENDPERINSTVDRLTTASHKLAEAMYKATSQQPGGQGPSSGDGQAPGGDQGKGKDNVVDAEFVDVDDKK